MSAQRSRLTLPLFALVAACSHSARVEPDEPHPPREGARVDAGLAPVPVPVTAAPDNTAVTPTAQSATVKISVRSSPPKVMVGWGKKKLGLTPLTIERPRESGPVDLVLRASGFFPVHTRAYTFRNDTISVRMTRHENRMTLFGAKQELPPEGAPTDPSLDPANAAPPPGPANAAPPPTAP